MSTMHAGGAASGWPQTRRPISALELVAVVLLHVAVLAALLLMEVVPVPAPVATLMVQILPSAPPAPEETPPRPKPPTPQVKPRPSPRPTPAPPVMAARSEAPAAEEAPQPVEKPVPAPPVPAAPATYVEPRFDANYLDNPAPVYPPISRRAGEEGKVVLRVHVEPDGRPSQVLVRVSSGFERLDRAAETAVWRWKFIPARRGQEAVAAWVLVPVVFSLRG